MKVLIVYASQKGSTADTCRYIQNKLLHEGIIGDCADARDCDKDVHKYDAFILGAPIYKSMWLPELNDFVKRNAADFGTKPVWIFSPCVRVMEPAGLEYAQANYIPQRLLQRLNVQNVKFFSGKLMQEQITHADLVTLSERYDGNQLQQLSGDHRDWSEMDSWLKQIVTQLKG